MCRIQRALASFVHVALRINQWLKWTSLAEMDMSMLLIRIMNYAELSPQERADLNDLHCLRQRLIALYPGQVFNPYVTIHCTELYGRAPSSRQWSRWKRLVLAHCDRQIEGMQYRHLSLTSVILLSVVAEKRRGNGRRSKERHFTRRQLIEFVNTALDKGELPHQVALPEYFEGPEVVNNLSGKELKARIIENWGYTYSPKTLYRAGLRIRKTDYTNTDYQRIVANLIGA